MVSGYSGQMASKCFLLQEVGYNKLGGGGGIVYDPALLALFTLPVSWTRMTHKSMVGAMGPTYNNEIVAIETNWHGRLNITH